MTFDHIGLFVPSIEIGQSHLAALLAIRDWTQVYEDPLLRVRVCFGTDASGIRYEIVAPFGEINPVSGVLNSRRNILNHVAYRVRDLASAMAGLKAQGARPLTRPQPAVAFGGARVVFFLTELNFIVELVELP